MRERRPLARQGAVGKKNAARARKRKRGGVAPCAARAPPLGRRAPPPEREEGGLCVSELGGET